MTRPAPLAGWCAQSIARFMAVPPGSRECLATLLSPVCRKRVEDVAAMLEREWARWLGPVPNGETKAKETP